MSGRCPPHLHLSRAWRDQFNATITSGRLCVGCVCDASGTATNMTSEKTPSEIEAVIHECPYCPETLYTFDTGDYDVDESYEYFHKPCVSTLCTEVDHLKSALCDQCLHLRLWHLLKCMQWGPGNDAFEVNLDRPFRREQFMSKTCTFCQLIQTLLLPGTYDPAKLESGELLFMDVNEDACLQLSLAKLSEQMSSTVATVFVDSGASIFRTPTIGALHIALTGQGRSVLYSHQALLTRHSNRQDPRRLHGRVEPNSRGHQNLS
jgi:hypothetical protein